LALNKIDVVVCCFGRIQVIIAATLNPQDYERNRSVTRTADIFGSSIVAVGAFNPAIFSPDWLERNQLIGQADAENAKKAPSLIVSQQVTVFETEWFAFQVLTNQFSLTSKGVLTPAFKDLAVGIFSLVPHTPITAIGLNFLADFRLGNEAEYYKIGDVLAPKTIWDSLYPKNNVAGLANLTIRIQDAERGQAPRSGNEKRISVQPSNKVKYGVFFILNDHRAIIDSKETGMTTAEQASTLIDSEWQNSWDDAVRVFDSIVSQALPST
jgi:hypothetical protein